MPSRAPSKAQDLLAAELEELLLIEDLSIRTHCGSMQSYVDLTNFPSKLRKLGQNNSSLMVSHRASYPSTPYVRRDPALESQRIHDFLADAPPYMRRQSDAASRRSMAQKIQDFDLAFEGQAKTLRRATR
jgi:hypothetical protein